MSEQKRDLAEDFVIAVNRATVAESHVKYLRKALKLISSSTMIFTARDIARKALLGDEEIIDTEN